MTYRANMNPLIAVYEDSGQTISGSGTKQLQFDTILHNNGQISSNAFTIDVKTFVTGDTKSDSSGGFGAYIVFDVDSVRLTGKGSLLSGNVTGATAGSSNEIIATTANENETIEMFLRRGSAVTATLDAFTRILGVIIE